jgi:hypothetical protein
MAGNDGKEMRMEILDHLWLDVELKLVEAGVCCALYLFTM